MSRKKESSRRKNEDEEGDDLELSSTFKAIASKSKDYKLATDIPIKLPLASSTLNKIKDHTQDTAKIKIL